MMLRELIDPFLTVFGAARGAEGLHGEPKDEGTFVRLTNAHIAILNKLKDSSTPIFSGEFFHVIYLTDTRNMENVGHKYMNLLYELGSGGRNLIERSDEDGVNMWSLTPLGNEFFHTDEYIYHK